MPLEDEWRGGGEGEVDEDRRASEASPDDNKSFSFSTPPKMDCRLSLYIEKMVAAVYSPELRVLSMLGRALGRSRVEKADSGLVEELDEVDDWVCFG